MPLVSGKKPELPRVVIPKVLVRAPWLDAKVAQVDWSNKRN